MNVEDTPWGTERVIITTGYDLDGTDGTLSVKKVEIDGEEMTTFHTHAHKHEIVFVEDGLIEIRLEDDYVELEGGDAHVIEAGEAHQIQNLDSRVAEIVEVGFPFAPDDHTVLEDPYAAGE